MLFILLLTPIICFAGSPPTIDEITPTNASSGQEVIIKGSNFGTKDINSNIKILYNNGESTIDVKIIEWKNDGIRFMLPENPSKGDIKGILNVFVNETILKNDFIFKAAPKPSICSISRNDEDGGKSLVVRGENLGYASEKNSIVLQYIVEKKDKEVTVTKFISWTGNKIEFEIPEDFPSFDTTVRITKLNDSALEDAQEKFSVQNPALNEYVKTAVVLKNNNNADESFILEYIANEQQRKVDADPSNKKLVFLGTRLEDIDLKTLSENKFSQDFIGKLTGISQYVTVGVSAVWLTKNHDLVTSPTLRIFINPKSYFAPRTPLFTTKIFSKAWLNGIRDKIDINFGYTAKSETDSSTGSKNTNYVLAGLSFEINRSALLNVGTALATKDVNNDKTQFYIGLTVDSNLLKGLGLMK